MENISEIMDWACSLIDVKYVWVCDKNYVITNNVPMYGVFDSLPTMEYILANGCNCVGLINLIRLKLNKKIPGHNNNMIVKCNCVGSISAWIRNLNNINQLEIFDPNAKYEKGTLLISKTLGNSFGHMAIVMEDDKILHSYSNVKMPTDGLISPGICISELSFVTDMMKLNFHYVCHPNIWMLYDF